MTLRFFLLGTFLTIICSSSFGQRTDTLEASRLMKEAAILADSLSWDSASILYEKAAEEWEKTLINQDELIYFERYFATKNNQIHAWKQLRKYPESEEILDVLLPQIKEKLGDKHPEYGNTLAILAVIYSSTRRQKESIAPFMEVLAIREAYLPEDDILLGEIFYGLGWSYLRQYTFYDEAIEYHSKALPILREADHKLLGNCLPDLGFATLSQGRYDEALDYFNQSLAYNQSHYSPDHPSIANSLLNIGRVYVKIGDNDKALANYFEAESIFRRSDHPLWVNAIGHIGILYLNLGDNQQALNFYKQALRYHREHSTQDSYKIAGSLVNTGIAYKRLGDFEKAIESYSEALKILRISQHSYLMNCLSSLGTLYSEQGEPEKGLKYLKEGLELEKKAYGPNHPEVGISLVNVGMVYAETEKYDQALTYLFSGLSVLQSSNSTFQLECLNNIGSVYLKMGDYENARKYYQEAIVANVVDYSNKNPSSHPTISLVAQNNYQYLASLKGKELAFRKDADKDDSFFLEADFCLQLAVQLIDKIRISYRGEDSKLNLQETTRGIYETALEQSLNLYEKTNQEQYQQRAFMLSEKSKAAVLNEAMKSESAKRFAAIPASILEQEAKLKEEIVLMEGSLFRLKNDSQSEDSAKLITIQNDLFLKEQSYDSLQKIMEKSYADYYQLKYQTEVASMEDMQMELADNEAFISYFLGDSILIGFALSSRDFRYFTHRIDAQFLQNINNLYSSFTDTEKQSIKEFLEPSYALYNALIAPVEDLIERRNLIISPDGLLAMIPFETLIKSDISEENTNFSALPYLINDHQISYAYSATIHSAQKENVREIRNQEILAFAPTFERVEVPEMEEDLDNLFTTRGDTVRGKLNKLNGSYREVESLSKYFSVKSFAKEMATEGDFKTNASSYGILHLATHAIIDPEKSMESYLVFTAENDSTSEEDNNLYAWELYNMELKAQMAVLSACNTGFGKLQRGEGVMSLGRAFAYAGVPSIVMSLWPAEDESTADLMEYFYKGLSEGMAKDEALRAAKVKFLEESSPDKRHPFYWAGFVVQGDAAPLEKSGFPVWGWVLIGGILLGLGYLMFRKRL